LVTTGAKVLFIDPIYLAMPAVDNGNIFATGELLGQISELCQELEVTLVLIHHLKRSAAGKDGPPELSDLQWSGYAEWCRQWVLIRRREPYEDGQPHRLELYAGGSEGHGAHIAVDIDQGVFDPAKPRKWDVLVQSAAEAKAAINKRATEEKSTKAEAQRRSDVLAIVEAAKAFLPEGETKSVIRDKAGISATRMNLALAIALKEQRLYPVSIQKSNWRKPVEGFSTKQSEQSVQHSEQSGIPSGGPPVGTPLSPLGEECPSGRSTDSEGEQSE
ncbi:MAG: hypothetical protein IAF94_20975, partial [Pirellulaceae bacterium]|nr:hypothetical protein [Pirellulaceae bacterium]